MDDIFQNIEPTNDDIECPTTQVTRGECVEEETTDQLNTGNSVFGSELVTAESSSSFFEVSSTIGSSELASTTPDQSVLNEKSSESFSNNNNNENESIIIADQSG